MYRRKKNVYEKKKCIGEKKCIGKKKCNTLYMSREGLESLSA